MSTGAIIAIVVVALIIVALLAFVVPRMRAQSRVRARERELQHRRERVAGEHRAEADQRERQATQAEQRARIAEREAEAERAQAELHQERAGMHERGMADDELIEDDERERFEGTSATRSTTDDEARGSIDDGRRSPGDTVPASEYDRGRRDEAADETRNARFDRDDETVAERDDTRTTR
jgi:type II secretory pathway pseudopilin PulG